LETLLAGAHFVNTDVQQGSVIFTASPNNLSFVPVSTLIIVTLAPGTTAPLHLSLFQRSHLFVCAAAVIERITSRTPRYLLLSAGANYWP